MAETLTLLPKEARPSEPRAGAALRRFPYPYQAMLAICSDLDETPDAEVYGQLMRYMNTTELTAMGPGAGLEVGNTIYFDMPADQFAYWNTDDAGRAMVRAMMRSGHIDCLHSFGDLASTRAQAGKALDELTRHDCRLKVWVDHAVAATNFGADIMAGHGDVPGDPAYHADLTCAYGVRYVWRGRVTSVTGQNVPARLSGIVDSAHAMPSVKTAAKEAIKRVMARGGGGKYAMHSGNRLMRLAKLRDGREVIEFIRCNPHWGGVSSADTASGFGEVVTESFLRRLIEREGTCILYTHLGKIPDRTEPFPAATRTAFQRLARLHREGRLLVTTTRRLLDYHRASAAAVVSERRDADGGVTIAVDVRGWSKGQGTIPGEELDGLTVYADEPEKVRLEVNGRAAEDLVVNPADSTGRRSVSLPWRKLEYPSW